MGFFHKLATLFRVWNTRNLTHNIKFLLEHDLAEAMWKNKDEVLDDCVFELDELRGMLLPLKPKVYNCNESLSILEREPKSFARIGDGEIRLMEGKDISFQKYDPVLAEKMFKLLTEKRADIYICWNLRLFSFIISRCNREKPRISPQRRSKAPKISA